MDLREISRLYINNMTKLVFANGETVRTELTGDELGETITNALPSSWIGITLENIGPVILNSFIIAYYYEE